MFPPVRVCELCQYNAVRVPADEAAEYAFRYDVRRFGENMAERCKSMLAGNVIDDDKECMELPTDAPSSREIQLPSRINSVLADLQRRNATVRHDAGSHSSYARA